MTWQELQKQALQLPISDRWRLVQSVLTSIEHETLSPISPNQTAKVLADLDPWTQSISGAIHLETETNAARGIFGNTI